LSPTLGVAFPSFFPSRLPLFDYIFAPITPPLTGISPLRPTFFLIDEVSWQPSERFKSFNTALAIPFPSAIVSRSRVSNKNLFFLCLILGTDLHPSPLVILGGTLNSPLTNPQPPSLPSSSVCERSLSFFDLPSG